METCISLYKCIPILQGWKKRFVEEDVTAKLMKRLKVDVAELTNYVGKLDEIPFVLDKDRFL